MTRALLLLAALAVPAHAAPQLKPEKPVPGTEEARIEALRAKYDRVRKTGDLEERMQLAGDDEAVRRLIRDLEEISGGDREKERAIVKNVGIKKPRVQDLYDIATHDREQKEAAVRK